MRPARNLCGVALPGAIALLGCTGAESDPSAAVFDPAVLHEVDIVVADADLPGLANDGEHRVSCEITYDGATVLGAGIRQKGNTLFALDDKPSFSIKLDDTHEDAEIKGLQKLILNGSKQDHSLFHEQLAASLFAAAGLPAGRVAHAKVRLNGEALGVYVVVEAIDKPFLRRHFGEKNDEGNLYEGSCCGDFTDDATRLSLDDEDKGGRTRADLVVLTSAILDPPDAELTAELEKVLDLDGFFTTHALEALLDHWDGYSYRLNNYYLYDNPADGRFVFLPHGMDRILEDPLFDPEEKPVAHLPQRLRAIPMLDFRWHEELKRVTAMWDEEAVLAALDRTAELVHGAGSEAAIAEDVKDFDDSAVLLRAAMAKRRELMSPAILCGDGKIEGLETCEDGNTEDGDGCSARCRIEP